MSERNGQLQHATESTQMTFNKRDPDTTLYVGDCRDVLLDLTQQADLIFADPPFNWDVPYDQWADGMPREDYLAFTYDWLDASIGALAEHGSLWVNISDDTVAEIVLHLKHRGLVQINWCLWHYRFGQNTPGRFTNSKVHALYFAKDEKRRTFNASDIMVPSDRATRYNDSRTLGKKDGSPDGMRLPFDIWGLPEDGNCWGRVQGNNAERRKRHKNQLPERYLERVILACSNPGDLVLDPFCGSGTTSTVARALLRRSITIEYSEQYAASAWQRIIDIGAKRVERSLFSATGSE